MNDEILSVQFGIYANEDIKAADESVIPADSLITYGNCDENGKLTFNCDLPIGFKCYAKEMATDNHYILSDIKHEFDTYYKGQETEVINIDLNNGEPIINDFIYGTIKGLKIDRETAKTIEGALFGLFRSDETEFTEDNTILTALTDNPGTFSRNKRVGFLTAAIRAISKNSVPLVSLNPFLLPAIENAWQGKPPQIRSISGKSSGLIFVASSKYISPFVSYIASYARRAYWSISQ